MILGGYFFAAPGTLPAESAKVPMSCHSVDVAMCAKSSSSLCICCCNTIVML